MPATPSYNTRGKRPLASRRTELARSRAVVTIVAFASVLVKARYVKHAPTEDAGDADFRTDVLRNR